MNEEIEYAEMLEIPVSTVNVVRKPKKRRKNDNVPPMTVQNDVHSDIKDTVIANVNERLSDLSDTEEQLPIALEGADGGALRFDPIPERIDTVRLYTDTPASGHHGTDYPLNDGGMYEMNNKAIALRRVLKVEFGLACALCGAIFLTNVFIPGSAINTFFRALSAPVQNTAKPYTEFVLSGVVSELSNAEINLSPTGILSLTDDCHIYPVADGKVDEVLQNENGLYTMKVCYSDTFTGVFQGLTSVYYGEGDTVKTNVPIGYTAGEKEVQVTMYSNGMLLNCFELTEENCLAWISTGENA